MKTPESVLKDFLLEWDIEDYGTEYTVQRMIETLIAEGYKIVPKVDLRPDQQSGNAAQGTSEPPDSNIVHPGFGGPNAI